MYLQTDFGYDEKLQIKLRVLAAEPDWAVDPTLYKYSMNIVGRIKVDGTFSEDSYDKIAAFHDGEVRGSVKLEYNKSYQEYYAFLTVYSDTISGDVIQFKIWDASQGRIIEASIETKSSVVFIENDVIGTFSNAAIFANTGLFEQKIALNKGWSWISLNVNDANFSDLNELTENLNLETSDRILSNSPAQLDSYFKNSSTPSNSGWSGSISDNGGFSSSKMYKVFTTHEQTLAIKGAAVALLDWKFTIQPKWNWLPYPLGGNQLTNEALAYFDAVDGDVIKSQNLFAIYDPIIGWNGTLNYLEAGKGYMLKSSKDQTFDFKYPIYLGNSATGKIVSSSKNGSVKEQEFKQYSQNMNAAVLLPKGYNELFVYDTKGVIKGVSKNQIVNDKELSFITIFGELPETLVFSVRNSITETTTSKSFTFQANGVLGTVAKPIILEEIVDAISIYSNPFKNDLTIKVNAEKGQKVTLHLYSLTSQLLFTKKTEVQTGVNVITISPNVATGVYLLQIEMNGKSIMTKVIKN